MIHFNELRISPDSKYLIIDISISNASYYTNTLITSISFDTQDTFVSADYPSTKAINIFESQEGVKHIRLVKDATELGTGLYNMFFIYIQTNGVVNPSTPCGMDNSTTLGVVLNMYPFYNQAMQYIKEAARTCTPSQNFVDSILRMEALKLALNTGNYTDAIEFYNAYFKGQEGTPIKIGGCGCGNN